MQPSLQDSVIVAYLGIVHFFQWSLFFDLVYPEGADINLASLIALYLPLATLVIFQLGYPNALYTGTACENGPLTLVSSKLNS